MAFHTRAEAGRRLAERLGPWWPRDSIVVALAPRGIKVAAEVAARLDAPLDAVLVHEVALPGCPPGVLGAVGENGVRSLDAGLAARFGIGPEALGYEARRLEADLVTVRRTLRVQVPEQSLTGRTVLLVDDGVATGAAAAVALAILRERGADPLVLAVPVGARGVLERLRAQADAVVCVREMPWPRPVSEWYEHRDELPDRQALKHLVQAMLASRTSTRREPQLAHA